MDVSALSSFDSSYSSSAASAAAAAAVTAAAAAAAEDVVALSRFVRALVDLVCVCAFLERFLADLAALCGVEFEWLLVLLLL